MFKRFVNTFRFIFFLAHLILIFFSHFAKIASSPLSYSIGNFIRSCHNLGWDLKYVWSSSNAMTSEYCFGICNQNEYSFAGVHNG